MRFFPENAVSQLEFDKIKVLLENHCRNEWALKKVRQLRIHTKREYIEKELRQTNEYKTLLDAGLHFPNDLTAPVAGIVHLLSIPGAMLDGPQFNLIRKLSDNTESIFRWFNEERREGFPALAMVVEGSYFEKAIRNLIDEMLDENGRVLDDASETLADIRMSLYKKRNELRRIFDKIAARLNKQGYLADIGESFMNGRRVLAVFAEQKRTVKGILHSESESRKTSFIEPEETIALNNDIFSLENDEAREVNRILRTLTEHLSVYASLLNDYYIISGEYDFIRAKARLAQDISGQLPVLHDKAFVKLIEARHPLLLLHNNPLGKPTIPTNITLDADNRILVISGPNAGGKTITLKTVGLLQIMLQSGLLIPLSPDSEMGIFRQLMIHIGDTQSIEYDLSTYSSHLLHMKEFMEHANGKTLLFVDELGSGSDPNLGGAFAEVIMQELARKHVMGIITTHYLNLKVMADSVKGIFNGAMQFDEAAMKPLYQLKIGSPGSSYTFSIAERIGLDPNLIKRARKLADNRHVHLDQLLSKTESQQQQIQAEKKQLALLMKENEKLKKEMDNLLNLERHRQEVEKIRLSNQIAEEKWLYLKDMERKIKMLIYQWRKAEDKTPVVKMMAELMMGGKEKFQKEKQQQKVNEKYEETGADIRIGSLVKMRQNRNVGTVKEIRGKKALLQVGMVPMLVDLKDIVPVKEKASKTENPDSPKDKA